MSKSRNLTLRIVLSALALALCYVLPFLTLQIPTLGGMLCPMHIPVLLCGFFCGPFWGAAVGLVAPLLRSLTIGAPPLFPGAVGMAAELFAYGFLAGLFCRLLPKKWWGLYLSLLSAMLGGRIVWGLVRWGMAALFHLPFTLSFFLAEAFVNALPGICLQFLLIPPLVGWMDEYSPPRGSVQ